MLPFTQLLLMETIIPWLESQAKFPNPSVSPVFLMGPEAAPRACPPRPIESWDSLWGLPTPAMSSIANGSQGFLTATLLTVLAR